VYKVKHGTIPQQLSIINSLIFNATQPFVGPLPRRRESNDNVLDQQSSIQTRETLKTDTNASRTKKEVAFSFSHEHNSEIGSYHLHQEEMSFKVRTESDYEDKGTTITCYMTRLGDVKTELMMEKESITESITEL